MKKRQKLSFDKCKVSECLCVINLLYDHFDCFQKGIYFLGEKMKGKKTSFENHLWSQSYPSNTNQNLIVTLLIVISKFKLDNTFQKNYFTIDCYKMFRLDRSRCRGDLILYIYERVPCKILTNHENSIMFQIIIFVLHLLKCKRLM